MSVDPTLLFFRLSYIADTPPSTLQKIKIDILPTLKVTKLNPDFVPVPQVKRTLNQARRSITPKIGQITNVRSVQERIVRSSSTS